MAAFRSGGSLASTGLASLPCVFAFDGVDFGADLSNCWCMGGGDDFGSYGWYEVDDFGWYELDDFVWYDGDDIDDRDGFNGERSTAQVRLKSCARHRRHRVVRRGRTPFDVVFHFIVAALSRIDSPRLINAARRPAVAPWRRRSVANEPIARVTNGWCLIREVANLT
jgi:hypothetical protein